MKDYSIYQYLSGTPMTERDKIEAGSPFWNEGKFNNFVKPFLKEKDEITLVDMGCNAGLFLKLAEDMGYKAIGVDSSREAIERGIKWRDEHKGRYKLILSNIENCIDELPLSDYTVLANAHYYFTVNDFLDYLDKLQYKTRYCIVVTDEKKHMNRCWASADVDDIRSFYKGWDEVGFIDVLPQTGGSPRKLRSLCFKSRYIDKSLIDKLDSSNHVQDDFYSEIDSGKDYWETKYYKILKKYRAKWGEEKLNGWIAERLQVYEDIKRDGMKVPIIIDKNDRILDGNHRYAMTRNLGLNKIFTRKV